MTGKELRTRLCGGARSFALTVGQIKDRLGEPRSIHLLPRWCRKTGRDVVLLSYAVEEGEANVFGTAGFLNGEQALFDGYVVVSGLSPDGQDEREIGRQTRLAMGQLTLFDG